MVESYLHSGYLIELSEDDRKLIDGHLSWETNKGRHERIYWKDPLYLAVKFYRTDTPANVRSWYESNKNKVHEAIFKELYVSRSQRYAALKGTINGQPAYLIVGGAMQANISLAAMKRNLANRAQFVVTPVHIKAVAKPHVVKA